MEKNNGEAMADHAKQGVLAGAAALLFPIDWPEPFGLVMIEAMACGTPVIAFRSGSVPEVVDHGITGFVVSDLVYLPPFAGSDRKVPTSRIRLKPHLHETVRPINKLFKSLDYGRHIPRRPSRECCVNSLGCD